MLYDFIIIDKTSSAPLYMQIYASIRRSVENGSLVKNTKLPSVRQLSSGLEVSKTTVSAAYEQLCVEGYIKNKPQSGEFSLLCGLCIIFYGITKITISFFSI